MWYVAAEIASWLTQPSTLHGNGNEYWYHAKCVDAQWLVSKGRMAHSVCGLYGEVWVVGKSV